MKQPPDVRGPCPRSHYAVIVDARSVEIYKQPSLGDLDCQDCLHRMAAQHETLAAVFRARLTAPLEPLEPSDPVAERFKQCRVYDALCINPIYCDARDACCAGDPDCRKEVDS